MLIDASHSEETRVTIVSGNKLEEFDFETASKKQLKGNVYLARITRVEPSLQAAFVEYGGNRHGFLAFNEIHPDYYQIPAEDREVEEVEEMDDDDISEDSSENSDIEIIGGDSEVEEEQAKQRRPKLKRHYKIQEVIKKRQVILIQITKEERGNKGAAITTYLSLVGRYCVLMPNTARGGGVSRKITNQADRKRLKTVLSEMEKPKGMGVIVRTAGAGRTKIEIKRDYEYTFRLWDKIRETTLKSVAPTIIHEEASLIHRSIRDMYSKEIDEVIVAGEVGYKEAKAYMKELTPSHAKKVQMYKDETAIPLFQRYQVEGQLAHIYDATASLKSGGTIVINQTEALVAIDVNSGRATKERHIDDTALKTNLEAAEEVARQLRLRDMAGLIVIDFIDMDCNKANAQVERKLKESLRKDRAKIQVGRISQFGLMEMSRQRLRPSLIEATSSMCPACAGSGSVPSTEVAAMMVVRAIEEEAMRRRTHNLTVAVPASVGFYLLNNKRQALAKIELNFDVSVSISVGEGLVAPAYEMVRDTVADGEEDNTNDRNNASHDDGQGKGRHNNNRNRRNNKNPNLKGGNTQDRRNKPQDVHNEKKHVNAPHKASAGAQDDTVEHEAKPSSNKRRRKRRNKNRADGENNTPSNVENNTSTDEGFNTGDGSNIGAAQQQNSSKQRSNPNKSRNRDQSNAPVHKKAGQKDGEDATSNASEGNDNKNLAAQKATVKKVTAKKATAKKATAKKATAKKATAKKATAKKATAKKATAKKATAKKATAKKATAKKATAKKATAKKATVKKAIVQNTPAKATAANVDVAEKKVDASNKTGWWSR